MGEEWLSIIGYEGFYDVSSLGRVRSHDRMVPYRIAGFFRKTQGKILKPAYDGYGYPFVTLYKGGIRKVQKIHQLVAQAFIGPCPEGHQINHKNGAKDDNNVDNLEYVTPIQNTNHSISQLGHYRHGSYHWKSKLSESDVLKIRRLYRTGKFTQQELADEFGVHRGQISKVCSGKSWRYLKALVI